MCRFTLYVGPEIRLRTLLIDQVHSLVQQSANSHEREDPVNGDGFGVGWYNPELSSEPAVFRSVTPAWNNRNLHNIARVVSSGCIMAHVRAATQSSGVNEANCHPFRYHQYTFMHNGDVGNFRKVRRRLMESVSDEAFNNVFGSTDSEHAFAVFIDELTGRTETDPTERLARALHATIARIVLVVARHGDAEPCYLNLAVTDGDHAAVCRFANDPDYAPESLYYTTANVFEATRASHRDAGDSQGALALVVSSERLNGDSNWTEIPANHIVLIRRGRRPELQPITVSEAVSAR